MLSMPRIKRPFQNASRRGAAIVEFAIMSQIVLLILFGTIDVCSLYYLRQSAKLAAIANPVLGKVVTLRTSDIVFGTSMRSDLMSKYVFTPDDAPYNSVRVNLDAAASGSLPLPMLRLHLHHLHRGFKERLQAGIPVV